MSVGELGMAAQLAHFVLPVLDLGHFVQCPLDDSLAQEYNLKVCSESGGGGEGRIWRLLCLQSKRIHLFIPERQHKMGTENSVERNLILYAGQGIFVAHGLLGMTAVEIPHHLLSSPEI
jgi:hypothetical protein